MSIIIRNFVDKKSGSSICKHSLGIHFWTCIITFSFDTFVLRYYRSIYSYIFLYIYIYVMVKFLSKIIHLHIQQ